MNMKKNFFSTLMFLISFSCILQAMDTGEEMFTEIHKSYPDWKDFDKFGITGDFSEVSFYKKFEVVNGVVSPKVEKQYKIHSASGILQDVLELRDGKFYPKVNLEDCAPDSFAYWVLQGFEKIEDGSLEKKMGAENARSSDWNLTHQTDKKGGKLLWDKFNRGIKWFWEHLTSQESDTLLKGDLRLDDKYYIFWFGGAREFGYNIVTSEGIKDCIKAEHHGTQYDPYVTIFCESLFRGAWSYAVGPEYHVDVCGLLIPRSPADEDFHHSSILPGINESEYAKTLDIVIDRLSSLPRLKFLSFRIFIDSSHVTLLRALEEIYNEEKIEKRASSVKIADLHDEFARENGKDSKTHGARKREPISIITLLRRPEIREGV
jgi:hypothetical protein